MFAINNKLCEDNYIQINYRRKRFDLRLYLITRLFDVKGGKPIYLSHLWHLHREWRTRSMKRSRILFIRSPLLDFLVRLWLLACFLRLILAQRPPVDRIIVRFPVVAVWLELITMTISAAVGSRIIVTGRRMLVATAVRSAIAVIIRRRETARSVLVRRTLGINYYLADNYEKRERRRISYRRRIPAITRK